MMKVVWLLLLSACFDSPQKSSSSQEINPADCDKDKAEKTLEQIKSEDYSLLKKNPDAGCEVGATPTP